MPTHRHSVSGKYTSYTNVDTFGPRITALEEAVTKLTLAIGGGSGGGTTPVPNTPPLPTGGPVISNVVISAITTTGATITWNTDVASTGIIRYGTGTGYGSTTAATASGTSHSRTLSGLTSGTLYHLRAENTASGLTALSSDRTFTTQQVPAPPPGTSITVASISALKAALANNTYTEIVVTDGTYHVSPASLRGADALWIGSAYAGRTNPVTVRAATTGGVTFDGADQKYMGFIVFADGAHHQTWEGFKFANGEPTSFGVIVFGSNVAQTGAAPHHITLNDIEFLSSLTSVSTDFHDHGIYVADALTPGVHDILVDGFTVTAPVGGIQSAVHFFHSSSGRPNANAFTVRNMTVTGTEQAIVCWDSTLSGILFEDCTITDAERFGVRHELGGAVTYRRVNTISSGTQGFYGSAQPNYPGSGSPPAGATVDTCSFA